MAADHLDLLRNLMAAQIAIQSTNTLALPMRVQVDYVRSAGSSTMANITVRFENRDLQFQTFNGSQRSRLNVFGHITTMTRLPVSAFEKPIELVVAPGLLPNAIKQQSVFQESVPLTAGRYRLTIVGKDVLSGNRNNYEVALDVPHFDDDSLALSSLVLADRIEKLPAKIDSGAVNFAIGDSKVRPRVGSSFTPEEKLGIYFQIYNFMAVGNAPKPAGSVEYEIDKAGPNERS